jgi:hypothetical protein
MSVLRNCSNFDLGSQVNRSRSQNEIRSSLGDVPSRPLALKSHYGRPSIERSRDLSIISAGDLPLLPSHRSNSATRTRCSIAGCCTRQSAKVRHTKRRKTCLGPSSTTFARPSTNMIKMKRPARSSRANSRAVLPVFHAPPYRTAYWQPLNLNDVKRVCHVELAGTV